MNNSATSRPSDAGLEALAARRGALVNVAATCRATRALGPGLRAALWVQGCPFRCVGCIAPEWIPQRTARLVPAADLADELLADANVTGLTFSGGEPMAQAGALAQVVAAARRRRDVTLICFTGFRLAELLARPPDPGVADLLAQTDVLVDGRYVAARNNGAGLRGSSNQRIHHLTGRLADFAAEFTDGRRRCEIRLTTRSAFLVGVPEAAVAAAFDHLTRGAPKGPR